MPTPWSNEAKTLFKLIGDGEWHPYHETLLRVAATIAPGRALRFYEHRLAYRRKHAHTEKTEVVLSEDERIYYGQRGLADRMIQGVKRRNLDFDGEREQRRIRLRPGVVIWAPGQEPQSPAEAPGVPQDTPADPEPSEAGEPDSVSAPQAEVEAMPEFTLEELGLGPMTSWHSCEECGLMVSDRRLHEEWHQAQNVVPDREEMALFAESEIRELIRQEVGSILDEHQEGLQSWLVEQFLQLEREISRSRGGSWLRPPTRPIATKTKRY